MDGNRCIHWISCVDLGEKTKERKRQMKDMSDYIFLFNLALNLWILHIVYICTMLHMDSPILQLSVLLFTSVHVGYSFFSLSLSTFPKESPNKTATTTKRTRPSCSSSLFVLFTPPLHPFRTIVLGIYILCTPFQSYKNSWTIQSSCVRGKFLFVLRNYVSCCIFILFFFSLTKINYCLPVHWIVLGMNVSFNVYSGWDFLFHSSKPSRNIFLHSILLLAIRLAMKLSIFCFLFSLSPCAMEHRGGIRVEEMYSLNLSLGKLM